MMHFPLKEFLITGAVLAAIMGVVLGLAFWANSISCASQWQDSGMKSRFELFAGCMIQLPTGEWIPASAYREIP